MTTTPAFDVMSIDCAGTPFTEAKNDFSCFREMIGKFGVYVFQDKLSGEVLYVGEAHKQDLKDRITQNYTEGDTGGTFKRNYCCDNRSFDDFKALLSNSTLKAISIPTDSRILIGAIEAILISALKPKYNK